MLMIQYIYYNPIHHLVQDVFLVKMPVSLKMRSRSPKPNHFSPVPMLSLCKVGQNQPTGSLDRLLKKLIFYNHNSAVTLKIESRTPKSNQFFFLTFNYPNDTTHEVWPESIIWVEKQASFFWSKFDIQSSDVTLKMKSRSPKSKHFFLPSNNVYVQVWSKSTYWFRRQNADKKLSGCRRDPHQKQYVPPPLRGAIVNTNHYWLSAGLFLRRCKGRSSIICPVYFKYSVSFYSSLAHATYPNTTKRNVKPRSLFTSTRKNSTIVRPRPKSCTTPLLISSAVVKSMSSLVCTICRNSINPYLPSRPFYTYILDESILFSLRGVWCTFSV